MWLLGAATRIEQHCLQLRWMEPRASGPLVRGLAVGPQLQVLELELQSGQQEW